MRSQAVSGIRNLAIVGPYSSGKTTLLESLLFVSGALGRKGTIQDKNTVGDGAAEARDRQTSVEISAAFTDYGELRFNFIDCPGSIEFAQETWNALIGVDAAIVVCEPEIDRVLTLSPLFKFLDDWAIPHIVFVNKMDRTNHHRFMDVLHSLQSVSSRPLVPHQYPIRQGDGLVGFIDLVSEQAFHYGADGPAQALGGLSRLPEHLQAEEQLARDEMLDALSSFDDQLLEQLMEEVQPQPEELLRDVKWELSADLIVPVFFGQADQDFGVRPLLDALVRETPSPAETAARRGVGDQTEPIAQVLKTFYLPQAGKLSLVRIWQGEINDGMSLNGDRSSGLYRLMGQQHMGVVRAQAGDIIAIARLDGAQTGDTLSLANDPALSLPSIEPLRPVFALAIAPEHRNDDVKLSGALNRLMEEDPALRWEQHGDTHEVILWGQGEIHLQVNLARLARKYHLPMVTHLPQVPYKETIRQRGENIHGRYKHQTGGHGQFGDVFIDIQPLPRGSGLSFDQRIVGGVVPKQYIPGVETGVREYLGHGPLGFPVVDVAVTLTNGSYHSVDSSEQAFRQAARIAMQEGMPGCGPTLLEPVLSVVLSVPSDCTAGVLRLVSGRRGQILGYDRKTNWNDWDEVTAYLPQAEMQDLIVELRSLTLGVGFFDWQPDHLQEVPDKLAERLLAQRQGDSAA